MRLFNPHGQRSDRGEASLGGTVQEGVFGGDRAGRWISKKWMLDQPGEKGSENVWEK